MIVENAGQEIHQADMENLINIPIELPGSSGILKEVVCRDQRNRIKDPLELDKMNKKKWKRLKGKENAVSECIGKLCIGADKVGKKRQ